LLLKQSPLVSHLALYDIVHVKGVAADLSHIETRARVTAHDGPSHLADCLKDADVVLIPAGVPRKPGTYTPTCLLALLTVGPPCRGFQRKKTGKYKNMDPKVQWDTHKTHLIQTDRVSVFTTSVVFRKCIKHSLPPEASLYFFVVHEKEIWS
uniref:Malate dehydrogenase, mitochondrial n=1 Tax=Echinostoma caproni TaxID=27848 RepID=A0A183BC67_9TREM